MDRITRDMAARLTKKILLALSLVYLISAIVLNAIMFSTVFGKIDSEMSYNLEGFVKWQSDADTAFANRLPTGLLPIIYCELPDGTLVNPHPSSLMVEEDIEVLLATNHPLGFSMQTINGRSYRVDVVAPELPYTFYGIDAEPYSVQKTYYFKNITQEASILVTLLLASVLSIVVYLAFLGPISYWIAQKSIAPIRESQKKQERFTADISHELRTPLSIIQLNADMLLKEGGLSETSQRAATSIAETSQRASRTLASSLMERRLREEQKTAQLSKVDVGDVLLEATRQFDVLFEESGRTLEVELAPGGTLLANRDHLSRLFSALLENAYRYTAEGGKVVVRSSKSKKRYQVSIEDDGLGIPDEDITLIFSRFYRSSVAREVVGEGEGLGLYIAASIAEVYGATLSAEPGRKVGACFTVVFPLK